MNSLFVTSCRRTAFVLVGSFAVVCTLATPSQARYGDCGQPDSNGTWHSSDSSYLLYTAVGASEYPAPLCVGDVNNSGTITSSDALIVLNEVNNPGSQTFSCPSGSTCTACNTTAVSARLAALTSGERVLAGTSTVFRCSETVNWIEVPSTWSATISVNDVIISARDRGEFNITTSITCSGSKPSTGYTSMTLAGNSIVVEDINNFFFWNGIEVSGDNNTFRETAGGSAGSWFSCKAGVLNDSGATGTELRDIILANGPYGENGYGVRSEGNSINTTSPCTDANALFATSTTRSCYNLASYGVNMEWYVRPFYFTGKGRYLSKDDAMNFANDACETVMIDETGGSGPDLRVRFDGSDVEECETGIRVKNGAAVAMNNGFVGDSLYRGVWASDASTATLRSSDIVNNGGSTAGLAHYGGVTTSSASSTIDMGSNPVSGNNVLCGNRDPSGYVQIDNDGGTITNYGNTVTNGTCP